MGVPANMTNGSLSLTAGDTTAFIPTPVLQRFHTVMAGVWFSTTLCGIWANFVNIWVFKSMGLVDAITVSFFFLAVSDFCICSAAFVELIPFLLMVLEREYEFQLHSLPIVTAHYIVIVRRIFNVTSMLITTFLALQRCICIVMPFHVNGIFTKTRTLHFMAVIFAGSTVCHMLYIWRHRVAREFNSDTNATQFVVVIPPGSEPYLFLMEAFLGIAMNVVCQCIVLVCVVLMGAALRSSTRFRKTALSDATSKQQSKSNVKGDERAVPKERQALIQVSLLSIIFIATNIPFLAYGVANLVLPEFGFGLAYNNLYHMFHNIMFTAELCNSSVNLVVYYKYNSKFRALMAARKTRKTGTGKELT